MVLVAMAAVIAMVSVGSTDTVINGFVQQFYISELTPFIPPPAPVLVPSIFLLIDEDSINNDTPPNFFSDIDINDQIADLGLRTQLPYFAGHIDETIALSTGQVGDSGWFAIQTIPDRWEDAGPSDEGLENFLGVNNILGEGLGVGEEPEKLLDNITNVIPLEVSELEILEGQNVCALVYDSDISIDYETNTANLMGATLGIVAFQVVSVEELAEISSSELPLATISILNAEDVCSGPLALLETGGNEMPDNLTPEQPPTIIEGPPRNATEDTEAAPSNSTKDETTETDNDEEADTTTGEGTEGEERSDADSSGEEGAENESGDEGEKVEDAESPTEEQQTGDDATDTTEGSEQETKDDESAADDSSDDESNDQTSPSEEESKGQ